VHILTEPDPVWNEMDHRQRLLEFARSIHATHIAMVDADELLTGNLLGAIPGSSQPEIRSIIEVMPTSMTFTLQLPWMCIRDRHDRAIVSGLWAKQDASVAFRDHPNAHWAPREGYHFHHRHPMGMDHHPYRPINPASRMRDGGLMHLQFLSRRRLRAKQALYQAIEVLRWPDRQPAAVTARQYGRTVAESEGARVEPVPDSWWAPYHDQLQYLETSEDVEPWQELELRRLVAEHGRDRFRELDFFGLQVGIPK
jgi:hypothetical protein